MPILTRSNPMGQKFILSGNLGEDKTTISLGNKDIVVNMEILKVSEHWYNWQIGGQLIQNAFPSLTPDQREFIMTGLTTEEWNELFDEDADRKNEKYLRNKDRAE